MSHQSSSVTADQKTLETYLSKPRSSFLDLCVTIQIHHYMSVDLVGVDTALN